MLMFIFNYLYELCTIIADVASQSADVPMAEPPTSLYEQDQVDELFDDISFDAAGCFDAPIGCFDAPDGCFDVPAGHSDAPAGLFDYPVSRSDAPAGRSDAPAGLFNTPSAAAVHLPATTATLSTVHVSMPAASLSIAPAFLKFLK